MDNLHNMVIKPRITEKSNDMITENKYVFKIPLTVNKIEIKIVIEKIFKVKIVNVNIIRVYGKIKRMGKTVGRRSDFKKAIVKLAPGNRIEALESI